MNIFGLMEYRPFLGLGLLPVHEITLRPLGASDLFQGIVGGQGLCDRVVTRDTISSRQTAIWPNRVCEILKEMALPMALAAGTGHQGTCVREVPPDVFVARLSTFLETGNVIPAPKWADLVKTAAFHQMPPGFTNWWYTLAASIARQVYLHSGTSVNDLRNRYGGRQHNGAAPCHFAKASGKIIRTILHQLEHIGWVEKVDGGSRRITPKGQKQLDQIAREVRKSLAE
jgi:small subunit ribosomal protein S19e